MHIFFFFYYSQEILNYEIQSEKDSDSDSEIKKRIINHPNKVQNQIKLFAKNENGKINFF